MKNKTEKILFLLLLTCSSCSSIYRFSVDIQEPALVTLPVSDQNVLILNNTLAQPKEYGIERMIDGQAVRPDFPLSLDSMVWSAIDEIADVLNESNFFNTIAIYRESLRTDTEWFSKIKLSSEQQSDFYDTEDYDALLVIDQLVFFVKEDVEKIRIGTFFQDSIASVDLQAEGIITCSMYSYGKEEPLTAFIVSDSVFVKSTVLNDSIFLFKEIPEYALNELSRVIANKAAKRFIPTWKTVGRILFVSYSPRMREAAGYAADHQWTKAESIWIAELEKKKKPADKAKIAFNLAVADEMQDKFESALGWTQKAKGYLQNANPNNNSLEMELTDKYISKLEERIQNNHLLDLQWGKE